MPTRHVDPQLHVFVATQTDTANLNETRVGYNGPVESHICIQCSAVLYLVLLGYSFSHVKVLNNYSLYYYFLMEPELAAALLGNIITNTRNHLSPEKAERLIF